MREVLRGQVFWVRFDPAEGSEQAGVRPAVVVQNDAGNRFSNTTILAAITSRMSKADYPFAAAVPEGALPRPSVVNCAQIRTMDKSRLQGEPLATLDAATMRAVDDALVASLGLPRGLRARRG